ncbi:MAG: NADH-quinone oxidoreductase subunit C [Burkholderiaceae bacterium]
MNRLDTLENKLQAAFGEHATLLRELGELTLVVPAKNWVDTCKALRDDTDLAFQICVDLCGVDYSGWGAPTHPAEDNPHPQRFAVVLHLLSVQHNWRLRVRCYVTDDEFPILPTLVDIWPTVNWFEREAFDLYGVVFEGHPDLRRILTDYGFIGHPFRKDFPISGHVEMRYDPEQKRVVYQPVSIEPREITPRVVREEGYGIER